MFPTPNAICNKAPFFLFLIRVIGAEEDSGFRSGEIWVYCEIEVGFSERREAGGGLWSGRAERMESCVRTPNRVLSGNASVFRGLRLVNLSELSSKMFSGNGGVGPVSISVRPPLLLLLYYIYTPAIALALEICSHFPQEFYSEKINLQVPQVQISLSLQPRDISERSGAKSIGKAARSVHHPASSRPSPILSTLTKHSERISVCLAPSVCGYTGRPERCATKLLNV
jgi:hypothetical protein